MSTNFPQGSVHNPSQVSRAPVGNSVHSSNNQVVMGKTVFNTVYQSQAQPQNQNASSQFSQNKTANSRITNNQSIKNPSNVQASNMNPQQNLSTLSQKIKGSGVQSVHPSAFPQQSVHNQSVAAQQSVHNASVHTQQQSVHNPSAFPQQSVHNPSAFPQQSVHNPSAFPQQSVHNPSVYSQQSMHNASVHTQQQSVHNPSVYPQQSVHKQSVNPQQSVHNQSVHPSVHPQQSVHNQSVHPSVHPSVHQSANPQQSTNSQVGRQSGKESVKPSASKLSRKSSLKASRNKSPPQVVRTSDGKLKRTNTDCSGNSFYVKEDEEKIMSDETISNHLDAYLNKEIVNTISKPAKQETHKKGNGFRYYGQLTKAGRNQNGETKIDQDTPLVHLNVGDIPGFNLFGVLDGHGTHGHFVSQFCRDYFIRIMTKYAESCKKSKLTTPEMIYNELKRTNFAYIIDAFNKADAHMAQQNQFDYNFSGTTCNIVFQFNKYLVCASVGDSRGMLVFDEGDKKNNGIFPLSHDHKPDLPGEIDRIKSKGGVVEPITDSEGNKVGPQRVWKGGCNYPGLAMSRSLGDFQAKEAGVISTPQIIEYTISRKAKYMIICSDGVWEFISNEQVRDMGNAFLMKNDVGGFCTDLVKFAMHSWEQFDIIRDDITVVCVFF